MKFRKPGDDIVLTKELTEMRDELTPKQIAFAENLVAQESSPKFMLIFEPYRKIFGINIKFHRLHI